MKIGYRLLKQKQYLKGIKKIKDVLRKCQTRAEQRKGVREGEREGRREEGRTWCSSINETKEKVKAKQSIELDTYIKIYKYKEKLLEN